MTDPGPRCRTRGERVRVLAEGWANPRKGHVHRCRQQPNTTAQATRASSQTLVRPIETFAILADRHNGGAILGLDDAIFGTLRGSVHERRHLVDCSGPASTVRSRWFTREAVSMKPHRSLD